MKAEFFRVCEGAKPAEASYVSLYENVPFYGGPEEGGWWGSDTVLVAHKYYASKEGAAAAVAAVEALAVEETKAAVEAWGDQCGYELDWLEARGLEPGFLPESAGHSEFFVVMETTIGSRESTGSRGYE